MSRPDSINPFARFRRRCRRRGSHRTGAFTLVEIMIVVVIVAILIIISIPGFQRARRRSDQITCQENLTRIDEAKATWALDHNETGNPTPTWDDLVQPGKKGYLEAVPVCPLDPNRDGSTYSIDPLNEPPGCSEGAGLFTHTFPVPGMRPADAGT